MDEKLEKYLTGRNFMVVCILLFVIFILLIMTAVGDLKKESKVRGKTETKRELVTSASRFYTVSSCVDKYLLYLSDENVKNLFAVLDDAYISKNNITEDTIIDKIGRLPSGVYNFYGRKMYQESISNAVTKYYVFGHLVKNESLEMNTNEEKIPVYYIVKLDASHLTFSITPYDGKIFQ